MAVYGTIEISAMLDKGNILKAEKVLNSYNVKNVKLTIETIDGNKAIFDTRTCSINDINVTWETEFDDEVC